MSKPDDTKKNDDTKNERPERPERPPERRPRPRLRIGADVIYCTRGPDDELQENAATVVKIHDSPQLGSAGVDLHVLYQDGETGREKRVHESEGLELGRWRWPARE